MEDQFGTHPAFALKPAQNKQPLLVNGFTFSPELFYSKEHIWARPMDRDVRLGLDHLISSFALEAESIKLPSVGSVLKKGQVLVEMTDIGRKLKVRSPLSGSVSAVNHDVEESPKLIWKDPYHRGWLLMIQPDHSEEISQLYSGEAAKTWFAKHAIDLSTLLMKWASKSSKKEEVQDGRLIRGVIRDQWDKVTEILLTHGEK
jgi:glycine cleavage system H protein